MYKGKGHSRTSHRTLFIIKITGAEHISKTMQYKKVIPGRFLCRPNRFIARVEVNGTEETVHVKNTGRCRELLPSGAAVYLSFSDSVSRKTKYDLIAVRKERNGAEPLLINMDSQIPNDVAEEWLRGGGSGLLGEIGGATLRREVRHGASRFDFYIESGKRKIFLEVKGCTLENDGVALFPDAPTERGVKHLRELTGCLNEGYEAYVLFVIQMKGPYVFRPNDVTDRLFGDALREAAAAGVGVLAVDCVVTPDSIIADKAVRVEL